jgi:hypothetical protein
LTTSGHYLAMVSVTGFVFACRSLFSRGSDHTFYSVFSNTIVHTKLQSTRSYIIVIGQDEKKEPMIDDMWTPAGP